MVLCIHEYKRHSAGAFKGWVYLFGCLVQIELVFCLNVYTFNAFLTDVLRFLFKGEF